MQVLADEDGLLREEDVIPNHASLLVFSRRGYIKRMPADLFAAQVPGLSVRFCRSSGVSSCRQSVGVSHQGRGRRGKSGARLRTDDAVEEVAQVTSGAASVAS